YTTPASACTATVPTVNGVAGTDAWCGLRPDGTRNFDGLAPSAPLGTPLVSAARIPVPNTVTEYIPGGSDERAWFAAFYLQDQWTLNRFTLSGALRYDNAQSRFGKTCVGP